MSQIISLITRHTLTGVGTYLVTNGYIDAEQAQAFVGATMTLAGIAWSIYDKKDR